MYGQLDQSHSYHGYSLVFHVHDIDICISIQSCSAHVVHLVGCLAIPKSILTSSILYSGPSILRPPIGPRKCGLILQVVLK